MIHIKSRPLSFAILFLVYALAAAIGVAVYFALPAWHAALRLLVADAAATVAVFLFSLLFGNASVYDPYWSVQPAVILVAFALFHTPTLAGQLVLVAVLLWALRLTANWAYTFHGLMHEDWRYRMLAEKTGAAYPLINFCGIHMFPTLVVYACVTPAVMLLIEGGVATPLTLLGVFISIAAAALQLVADIEMQKFRLHGTGGFIRAGLWRYSRHPNYLGEILMWWGVAISVVSVMPSRWYLFGGALLNTLMFLIVSIPMADRRQAKKEGYDAYRAATRSLLPLPRRGA